MPSLFPSLFRKTVQCPTSEDLLEYKCSWKNLRDRDWIERHLESCDFCDAELHLLGRYQNESEEYSFVEMPPQIRQLAEDLLKFGEAHFPRWAELTEIPHVSH